MTGRFNEPLMEITALTLFISVYSAALLARRINRKFLFNSGERPQAGTGGFTETKQSDSRQGKKKKIIK